MAPKKILIFSLSYLPLVGGAEYAVKDITDRIPAYEIEFDMVTLRFDRHHPAFERVGNVNVYRIGGGLGYLSKIFFIPQAALFALRRTYDLHWAMMTYMLFPLVLLRLVGKRTPYVLTLQDGDPFTHVFNRWRILPFRPLMWLGFRGAARVQAISTFLAHWAKERGYKGEVAVIPNGVDTKKFGNDNPQSFDPEHVSLITVSRLVEKNGVGDIIEALKLLPDTVSLKVLGTGPLEAELKRKAEKLGLESRVTWVGTVTHDELPRHLREADIFVRPSLSEGQGTAFIEAMAAGLPIIGTPVGGILDFLKEGETGMLCKPKDPQSIAAAVIRLTEDPTLRERVKTQALTMVREKYDWDLITRKMKGKVFGV